jgi:DNA-binding transcriptional LysR family regulator
MSLSGFDWSDLIFFLELARQGRLVPAAKKLRADHTTVSRRVAELERGLNCKLFDRSANGFVLTDAGQKLFAYAEVMESNALAIEENVAGVASVPSGNVRIATMEGIGSFYLAPRIPKLRALFPEIRVELVTERHLINLTKREADISISFAQMKGPRLISEKIGTFQLRLYAAPSYLERMGSPASLEDLDNHDFVDYVDDLVAISEVRWLHDVLVPSRVVFQSSSMIAQHNAAVAGVGLVLLPSFSAATDTRLIPVLTSEVSVMRSIWLTVHEDHQYLSRIKAVKRFLKAIVSEDEAFLNGLTPPRQTAGR